MRLITFLSEGGSCVDAFEDERIVPLDAASMHDVIAAGIEGRTSPGAGSSRTPPVYLKGGDLVSVEAQGLGTLTNRVQEE